jgi:hypothetical protein
MDVPNQLASLLNFEAWNTIHEHLPILHPQTPLYYWNPMSSNVIMDMPGHAPSNLFAETNLHFWSFTRRPVIKYKLTMKIGVQNDVSG